MKLSLRYRVSGTACETLASSAAPAASPPVRRSCVGRRMSGPMFAILDLAIERSGIRSTEQTQALYRSVCGVGCSSRPSSRKSKGARRRATTRKDESPIECAWNTFTHERPPFEKDCRYEFITRFWGNFWASQKSIDSFSFLIRRSYISAAFLMLAIGLIVARNVREQIDLAVGPVISSDRT